MKVQDTGTIRVSGLALYPLPLVDQGKERISQLNHDLDRVSLVDSGLENPPSATREYHGHQIRHDPLPAIEDETRTNEASSVKDEDFICNSQASSARDGMIGVEGSIQDEDFMMGSEGSILDEEFGRGREASLQAEDFRCGSEASLQAEDFRCGSEASLQAEDFRCESEALLQAEDFKCGSQASLQAEDFRCGSEASLQAEDFRCGSEGSLQADFMCGDRSRSPDAVSCSRDGSQTGKRAFPSNHPSASSER